MINSLVTAISLIIALSLTREKRLPFGVVGYILLPAGLIALLSSIFLESSILAFIGLGLTFWSILLLYIRPARYVKANLLDSTAFPSLMMMEQMMKELGIEGKAVYLPPGKNEELRGGKIIILKAKGKAEEAILKGNSSVLYLTPPGVSLTNLYEDRLGKEFAGIDINDLQENLQKIFIEDLEIAEKIEMKIEDCLITMNIQGTPYSNLCMEVTKLKSINNSVGCPFCSSIAIAINRSTGKSIIIEDEQVSNKGKNIEIKYRTLLGAS